MVTRTANEICPLGKPVQGNKDCTSRRLHLPILREATLLGFPKFDDGLCHLRIPMLDFPWPPKGQLDSHKTWTSLQGADHQRNPYHGAEKWDESRNGSVPLGTLNFTQKIWR